MVSLCECGKINISCFCGTGIKWGGKQFDKIDYIQSIRVACERELLQLNANPVETLLLVRVLECCPKVAK